MQSELQSAPMANGGPTRERRRELAPLVLLAIAIVVAIAVRVLFLADKPFWRDEAWAAALVDDPASAVAEGRPVPYGFLWLIRLTRALVPGPPEISYRIVPLVVGIAIVPLVARAAELFGAVRWVAVAAAWTAVGLVPLVYYSRELKPYDIDMFVALVAPMLAVASIAPGDRQAAGVAGGAGSRRVAQALLFALVVAAPWVTFAGIFPIAALLAWGWLAWAREASPRERTMLIALSIAFAASFAASYLVAIAPQVTNPRLLIYWQNRMLGSGHGSFAERLVSGVVEYFRLSSWYFFGKPWMPVLAVAAVGAITWPRRYRYFLAWMYFGTAAFCLAASLADKYLIAHGRHLMFAMPPLLLWTANGLWALTKPLGPRLRTVATIALPVVFALHFSVEAVSRRIGPYKTNSTEFFRYDTLQNVDEALTLAEPLVRPEDPLFVSLRTGAQFQFYARGRFPQATYCRIACPDWENEATRWLADVSHGWLLMTDEETKRGKVFLEMIGFAYDERVSVRGVRVWELRRVRGERRTGD